MFGLEKGSFGYIKKKKARQARKRLQREEVQS